MPPRRKGTTAGTHRATPQSPPPGPPGAPPSSPGDESNSPNDMAALALQLELGEMQAAASSSSQPMGPVGLNKGKQRATSVSTREDSAPPADPVSVPEAEGGPSAAQRDHNSARPITPTPHDSQALSREASVASSPASHAPNSPPQQQVYQVHPPRVERVPITLGKRPLEGTDPETEKITLTPGELEDIIARAVASAADNGRSIGEYLSIPFVHAQVFYAI
ncbi:hypothetical protein JOM56_015740 [Amanita muscaria]